MKKLPTCCLLTLLMLLSCLLFAQEESQHRKPRLFIECLDGSLCRLDYIRRELPVVDFVQDRFTADVHILVVSQPAGSGGSAHTITFIGRGERQRQDTTVFYTGATVTEDESRRLLVRQIKIGIMPWLMNTTAAEMIDISFRQAAVNADSTTDTRDKWNGWVFSVGGRLYLNGDKNYHEHTLGFDFYISKVTPSYKTSFGGYQTSTRNKYEYSDGNEAISLKTLNAYRMLKHDFVKSINPRWSLGYELSYTRSTYDNLKNNYSFSPGIEYNIFPYSVSSSKFLAIRYQVEGEHRTYFEETLYAKENEWLFSHDLGLYAAFTQKWGSINGSLAWYNYLHDVSKNNLSLYLDLELRLVKGLSLNLYTSASIINDQLNIARAGADAQEMLLKLKALSTSYNYYTSIGLRYRFGSIFNNVVNPRFTNGRY